MLKIRPVTLEDAPELVRIYAPYVEKTAITFEYQVPTIEEFEGRIEKILQRFPFLVAEVDGQVIDQHMIGRWKYPSMWIKIIVGKDWVLDCMRR